MDPKKSPALLGIAHQAPGEDLRNKLKLKEGQGAEVTEVHRESPAAKAGLQAGDVIVSLGGKEVGSPELGDLVRTRSPGEKLEIVFLRGAEKITKTVELADREKFLAATTSEPAKKPEPAAPPKPEPVVLGLLVEETDAGLAVQNVEAGKTGAAAQIKEGDVILALNGKKVKKLEDLTEARDKAKIGEELAIEYKRKDGVVRATVVAAGEKGEPKFLKIDKVEESKPAEPAKSPEAGKGPATLGVTVSEDNDGLRVVELKAGGAAAAAGLAKEDLIKEVAGQKLKTIDDLKSVLAKRSAGESVSITIARGSEQKVFEKVKLGGAAETVAAAPEPKKTDEPKKTEEPKKAEEAKPAPAQKPKVYLGISAQETDDLRLVVATVKEKGPADKGGLKKDDQIVKVNGVEIKRGFDDLEKALGNLSPGDVVRFVVKRGEETKEIEVQLGASETGADLEEG